MADEEPSGGLGALGGFIIAIIVILIIAFAGWFIYRTIRARRLGLPPPSLNPFARRQDVSANTGYRAPAPAPSNPMDWIKDKFNAVKNKRTTTGGYESTGYGGSSSRRGFGPLDPDEAWDARVGNEAEYQGGYYEEQELGLQDPGHGPYGGGGYGDPASGPSGAHQVGVGGIEEGRGRSRERQKELDNRYDELNMKGGANPFGEGAERSDMHSLREASPRPLDTAGAARPKHKRGHSNLTTKTQEDDSPTERRSMFREDV